MRHPIQHPTQPQNRAVFGFDHVLGWFVDVEVKGRIVESYAGAPGQLTSTLAGALRCLVRHGFLDNDSIAAAQQQLAHVADLDEIDDEDTRRAAEVLLAAKRVAGE